MDIQSDLCKSIKVFEDFICESYDAIGVDYGNPYRSKDVSVDEQDLLKLQNALDILTKCSMALYPSKSQDKPEDYVCCICQNQMSQKKLSKTFLCPKCKQRSHRLCNSSGKSKGLTMCMNCKSFEFEPENKQLVNLEKNTKQSQTVTSSLLTDLPEEQGNAGRLVDVNQCFKNMDQQIEVYKDFLVAQKISDLYHVTEDVANLNEDISFVCLSQSDSCVISVDEIEELEHELLKVKDIIYTVQPNSLLDHSVASLENFIKGLKELSYPTINADSEAEDLEDSGLCEEDLSESCLVTKEEVEELEGILNKLKDNIKICSSLPLNSNCEKQLYESTHLCNKANQPNTSDQESQTEFTTNVITVPKNNIVQATPEISYDTAQLKEEYSAILDPKCYGFQIFGSEEFLRQEVKRSKPQIDLSKIKIHKLRHGGIAISTPSPLIHLQLLQPWPEDAFVGANVQAHLPSYGEDRNKVILKNALQSDKEIEEILENLLFCDKKQVTTIWSVVRLRRFTKKHTSEKVPIVLVELFCKEDADSLLQQREHKGLRFEKLKPCGKRFGHDRQERLSL